MSQIGPGVATVREVSAHLRLSARTVHQLISDGKLASVKIGHSRRVPWAAVEELVRMGTNG